MIKPNCLSPVVILNPQLNQSVVRFSHYYIDGVRHIIDGEQRCRILNGEKLSKVLHIPYAHTISRETLNKLNVEEQNQIEQRVDTFLDSSFFFNENTSEVIPIYQYVPCGHCECCQSSQLASYVQRCQFHLQQSMKPAYFCTLTFNDKYLPSDVSDKTLFQKFKKRLRRNLQLYCVSHERECDFTSFKSICTSEIGNKTNRVHYHCVIFGMPILSDLVSPQYDENKYLSTKMLQYCWRQSERNDDGSFVSFAQYINRYPLVSKHKKGYDPLSFGYLNVERVDSGSSTIRYIMKYAFKDYHDNSEKKPWKSVSINLGLEWTIRQKSHILNSKDGQFEYLDFLSGKIVKTGLTRYFINKLFPSESKLIPVEFRRAYYNLQDTCSSLIDCPFADNRVKKLAFGFKLLYQDKYPFMYMLNEFSYSSDEKFDSLKYSPVFRLDDNSNYLLDSDRIKFSQRDFISSSILQITLSSGILDSFNIVYEDILNQINDRANFFSKLQSLPKLSYGQLIDKSAEFVKSIKTAQSKSIF